MNASQNPLFATVLALPQAERADLALRLLESLDPPEADLTPEQFGAELHGRVDAYRNGTLPSHGLDETFAILNERHGKQSQ